MSSEPLKAPLHIIVTDDDVDKRFLIGASIAKALPHASVFECQSGREALDYFGCNRVDLVVTDHNMVPVDGIELVREIRRRGSDVPIVMVTGYEAMQRDAVDAGADIVINSVRLMNVGSLIKEFLDDRAARRADGSD